MSRLQTKDTNNGDSLKLNDDLEFMIVEDDEVDIMNITRAFSKNNITNKLHIARDGQESLDMLLGTETSSALQPAPHIILLDINMPRMNGLEFLEKIRQDKRLKSILVYIMSTSNEPKDIKTAYSYNIAGYILKPIKFHDFVYEVSVMKKFWSLLEI